MKDQDLSKYSKEDLEEKAQQIIREANDISYSIKEYISQLDFSQLSQEDISRLFEMGEDVRKMHKDYDEKKKALDQRKKDEL
ncbi:hypothetical protein BKI52_05540 [marine bacterium AO1-C]|nr:hypothetical protein BKI52_05540 [marine bacterium AO1-C]